MTGEVAAVVFRNDGTGFGVVELAGDGNADGARAAGPLAALVEGQPVRLRGRWNDHERYGPTFTTVAYEITAPQTAGGLVTFLSSDRFPGVGPKLAARIVEAFGLDVATVIAEKPEELEGLAGISASLARTIADAWREAGALPELVATLTAVGLSPAAVTELHRRHGADAVDVIHRDPYAVIDLPGVKWAHAERLAAGMDIGRNDPRRLVAAVRSSLMTELDQGHTCADTAALREAVARHTGCDALDNRRGMDTAVAQGHVAYDEIDGRSYWALASEQRREAGLAHELARLLGSPRRRVAVSFDDDELTDLQRRAVTAALSEPVSVLTGGPGTGKTRSVRAVVQACAAADLNVALCAPTGRAAKRLEELTGHAATTVHRLLEAQPTVFTDTDDATFTFSYGRDRRLPHDVIVMDEASMADTALAGALVEAVDDGSGLLLVGDIDQLPSVGPGAVLRDILRMDPAIVGRVHLDQVHRQAAKSRIVTMAHELRSGAVAPPRGRDGDVFAVPQPARGLADRIAEIVAVRAPAFYDIEPSDVQVLAPMYRGPGGVDHLNVRLGERLNPPAGRPTVAGFREGDRVVQTRNDAELDVANGEVGEVAGVDVRAKTLRVGFPGGMVTFSAVAARNLRPAWCLTVHKSQGGEWPVVVLVLDRGHRSMLYRELVYTAVTRARRGLLLVGDPSLVSAAARRSGSGLEHRRTALVARVGRAMEGRAMGVGARGATDGVSAGSAGGDP